jgi:hypothetical protein
MLAGLAAAQIPTRTASSERLWLIAGDRLEVAAVGEGVVQGSTGMPREA